MAAKVASGNNKVFQNVRTLFKHIMSKNNRQTLKNILTSLLSLHHRTMPTELLTPLENGINGHVFVY